MQELHISDKKNNTQICISSDIIREIEPIEKVKISKEFIIDLMIFLNLNIII